MFCSLPLNPGLLKDSLIPCSSSMVRKGVVFRAKVDREMK